MPGFFIPVGFGCADAGSPASTYAGPENTVETARQHRYIVEICQPMAPVVLYAYQCTRPEPDIDVVVIHNGQNEIHRPGKHRWRPVQFTFYEALHDVLAFDGPAYFIYNWWANVMINLSNTAISRPLNYLQPVMLTLLTGIGMPAWRYYMLDCWPSKVTPSQLSYADSKIAEISVTLEIGTVEEGV